MVPAPSRVIVPARCIASKRGPRPGSARARMTNILLGWRPSANVLGSSQPRSKLSPWALVARPLPMSDKALRLPQWRPAKSRRNRVQVPVAARPHFQSSACPFTITGPGFAKALFFLFRAAFSGSKSTADAYGTSPSTGRKPVINLPLRSTRFLSARRQRRQGALLWPMDMLQLTARYRDSESDVPFIVEDINVGILQRKRNIVD
jgi:hypothetical protein